jgi:hypothetical protein
MTRLARPEKFEHFRRTANSRQRTVTAMAPLRGDAMAGQRRGEARPIGIWLMRVRRGCSLVAAAEPSCWLPLRPAGHPEEKSGSAATEPLRWLSLRDCDSLAEGARSGRFGTVGKVIDAARYRIATAAAGHLFVAARDRGLSSDLETITGRSTRMSPEDGGQGGSMRRRWGRGWLCARFCARHFGSVERGRGRVGRAAGVASPGRPV